MWRTLIAVELKTKHSTSRGCVVVVGFLLFPYSSFVFHFSLLLSFLAISLVNNGRRQHCGWLRHGQNRIAGRSAHRCSPNTMQATNAQTLAAGLADLRSDGMKEFRAAIPRSRVVFADRYYRSIPTHRDRDLIAYHQF